jgi:hypothetical protein
VIRLPPCPYLPPVAEPLPPAAAILHCGADRGPGFYLKALECAQSLWRQGLPAQSLLLINRAYGADLPPESPCLADWPWPYAATAWVMRFRVSDHFLGNPRRHFQHYATRMSGPRALCRTWRAWACWRLACLILPTAEPDAHQLAAELVREPTDAEITHWLNQLGHPSESDHWQETCALATLWGPAPLPAQAFFCSHPQKSCELTLDDSPAGAIAHPSASLGRETHASSSMVE